MSTRTTFKGSNIFVKVPKDTDRTNLVAKFTLSPGTRITVGGTAQVSRKTANDFSNDFANPVTNVPTYRVTEEDGSTTDYKVYVMKTLTRAALEGKIQNGEDVRYVDTSAKRPHPQW